MKRQTLDVNFMKNIELSQQDAERFFQAIDNPPEPSEKLVEAFRAYKGKFADAEDRNAQQEPQ